MDKTSIKTTLFFVVSLFILAISILAIDYFNLWLNWGVPHGSEWFIDFHALVSAAECDSKGFNVFIENPCDNFNRVHVYSRIWLLLDDIGVNSTNYLTVGFFVSFVFIMTFLFVTQARNPFEFCVTASLLISPIVLLGIERANNDLIIFTTITLACFLIDRKNFANQIIAYSLLILSAILKFYPLIAFCLYLLTKRSNKSFWGIALLTSILATLVVVITQQDLKSLALPTPSYRWIFGSKFIFEIPFPSLPYFKISILCWFVLASYVFFITQTDSRNERNFGRTNSQNINVLLFTAGYSISFFAFLTTNNYDYRCIFLLMCLPLLFDDLRSTKFSSGALINISLLIIIFWWEAFLQTTLWALSIDDQHRLFDTVRWFEQLLTWILMFRLLKIWVAIIKEPLLLRLKF